MNLTQASHADALLMMGALTDPGLGVNFEQTARRHFGANFEMPDSALSQRGVTSSAPGVCIDLPV